MDFLSPPSPATTSPLSPDEEKLLAKLEAQNRLLETDSKSLYSVSGVLHSPSAPKVFSFEEESWNIWGYIVKEWDDWSKRKVKQLKEMVRRGIPHHFRSVAWQLLCNSQNAPVRKQYSQLLKMSSPYEKVIRRELTKTLSHHTVFQGQDGLCQKPLFNVIKAYSILDKEIGYSQKCTFIVGLLLTQMPEEEAFSVFVMLMQEFRLRELYKSNMTALGLCVYQFEGMVQEDLPELHSHFQAQGFQTAMYSADWFLTLFLSSFPLSLALRVFDIFLCEGLEIVFRVGMAILQMNQEKLMNLDLEGLTRYLQNDAPHQFVSDPERLIAAAYQVKYNPKKLKKLERDYTTIKMKEQEDQEEIRRLRSENRLLRQKIETLEKVSTQRTKYSEDLVVQMEQELMQVRLNEAACQCALKQMQAEILHLEKSNTVHSDENSVTHLQEQLISGRLREAESLTELKELRQHIKDLDEQWQRRQIDQWRVTGAKGSVESELQNEVMTARLGETHTQALLRESRHRLLQLETQKQIYEKQLRRVEQENCHQGELVQRMTAQNQHLREQLQGNRQEGQDSETKTKDVMHQEEADNMTTITKLQRKITELQAEV
ncbi:ecotropic viral integration site 5 protein homolog [Chanos chanos]|uniref:Ecotropic viral integration site 5 protein homolog n=1 Tax=Chanos chanos TaxID=29144 RepID=A0A6J2VEF3_CHACN|nr:ecotropic viral integration site 5 protein homolog [Chanos chanos]